MQVDSDEDEASCLDDIGEDLAADQRDIKMYCSNSTQCYEDLKPVSNKCKEQVNTRPQEVIRESPADR